MLRVSLPQGWTALALSGVLALGLTACGGSDAEGETRKGP